MSNQAYNSIIHELGEYTIRFGPGGRVHLRSLFSVDRDYSGWYDSLDDAMVAIKNRVRDIEARRYGSPFVV